MTFDLLSYDLMLQHPQMLSGESAWVGHIPFAMALVQMAQPRVLVELGTHHGDSYLAFCQAVKTAAIETRCYAVDSWQGDEHAGKYDEKILERLKAYHDPLYSSFSQLMRMDFAAASTQFVDGQIDILHIDGLHTYDAVRNDFRTWLPKMSDRGVVLFHDVTCRTGGFGVWQLWEEISTKYPSFLFEHEYGLGVLVIGSKPPQDVADFIAYASAHPARVRGLFARLAEVLRLRQLAAQMLHATHQLRLAADSIKQRIGLPVTALDLQQVQQDPLGFTRHTAQQTFQLLEELPRLLDARNKLDAECKRMRALGAGNVQLPQK